MDYAREVAISERRRRPSAQEPLEKTGGDLPQRRRPVGEHGVWPDGVVVPPPAFDHDLGPGERVEDLAVEDFVP